MARIWFDGFEYSTGQTTTGIVGTLYTLYNTTDAGGTAYTGGGYLRSTATNCYIYKTLDTAKTEVYVKFHYYPYSVADTVGLMGFYKGSTCLGWVRKVNRTVQFFSGTGTGTQLGSTSGNVFYSNGTDWNLIEVRLLLDDSTGYAQVKVNQTLAVDFGPGDTKPGADADIDRIQIGSVGGASCTQYFIMDDFILDDAEWIGNKRVGKIQPNGPGASTQWTPSTGSNWSCVDESPFSDTDYIYVNSTDQIDLYDCADLPSTAVSAKGVLVTIRAMEEGTSTPQNVQIALRTNSTNYFGDNYAPPVVTAGYSYKMWTSNPYTGQDFTVAEINAIQVGIKSVT